ncbi:TRAP transporter small permease subunit [Hasllibacter sp. MH4015]|uniref:TRAP transporter small permease subunit n=1 Tax=Hasllibacter sp. MH4015 TaxID=2854029 RepID=UPI001CD51866|nr:TRAP transporter small permease [Hasllibacter sp. MH4015]
MAETMLNMLKQVNKAVAGLVGLGLLLCAAFVLIDIVLRQMGASFGGTDEISGYAMAIATSWGMGYALMELGHVRIDLIRNRTGQVGRSLFDLFSMAVLSGTVTLIAVKCWPVLERSLNNASRANTPLETPLAWVQVPWMVGWVWFAIVAWLTFVAAALLVLKGNHGAVQDAIGIRAEAEALE